MQIKIILHVVDDKKEGLLSYEVLDNVQDIESDDEVDFNAV